MKVCWFVLFFGFALIKAHGSNDGQSNRNTEKAGTVEEVYKEKDKEESKNGREIKIEEIATDQKLEGNEKESSENVGTKKARRKKRDPRGIERPESLNLGENTKNEKLTPLPNETVKRIPTNSNYPAEPRKDEPSAKDSNSNSTEPHKQEVDMNYDQVKIAAGIEAGHENVDKTIPPSKSGRVMKGNKKKSSLDSQRNTPAADVTSDNITENPNGTDNHLARTSDAQNDKKFSSNELESDSRSDELDLDRKPPKNKEIHNENFDMKIEDPEKVKYNSKEKSEKSSETVPESEAKDTNIDGADSKEPLKEFEESSFASENGLSPKNKLSSKPIDESKERARGDSSLRKIKKLSTKRLDPKKPPKESQEASFATKNDPQSQEKPNPKLKDEKKESIENDGNYAKRKKLSKKKLNPMKVAGRLRKTSFTNENSLPSQKEHEFEQAEENKEKTKDNINPANRETSPKNKFNSKRFPGKSKKNMNESVQKIRRTKDRDDDTNAVNKTPLIKRFKKHQTIKGIPLSNFDISELFDSEINLFDEFPTTLESIEKMNQNPSQSLTTLLSLSRNNVKHRKSDRELFRNSLKINPLQQENNNKTLITFTPLQIRNSSAGGFRFNRVYT